MSINVVAFGDSITGSVVGITPDQQWQRLLAARQGPAFTIINAGVGGNSAREAMARFERDVLAHRPNLILIEFGGNNHDPRHPERQVGDAEFLQHLDTFRAGVPASCRVVMLTFPPIIDDWHAYGHHPAFAGTGLDGMMQSQRQIVRAYAQAQEWPLLDFYSLMWEHRHDLLLPDGVHLNAAGHAFFAENISACIRKLFPAP